MKGQWNSALDRGSTGIVEFIICCINQRFNYVADCLSPLSPSLSVGRSSSQSTEKVHKNVNYLQSDRKKAQLSLSSVLALIKLSGKQTQRKLF